jgi:ATP-dependent helicase HrpB
MPAKEDSRFHIQNLPPAPIDEVLHQFKAALVENDSVVLQAPPGAGKTTRVPLALLDEPWLAGKKIVMLEPRRLAAANAARFMASLLGEEVGDRVGYAIRFERRVSKSTRIEVVTEGILTRRLQCDPALEGVGLVIFDEFHERHLHSDLALALCHDAQIGLRDDLKIVVMSATLDAAPVAALLGGAPLVTTPGRAFPVDVRYFPTPAGQIAVSAAAAVRRALREAEGDVLVFLPGAGEIRRCLDLLSPDAAASGLLLCPLYGNLPYQEQERAILPAAKRKVVLATNIAETSLTIEGIRTVIDSGFARQPRFDAASGLSRLETVRISRASADQRAGRAGRLAPGVCYRLWSEGEHGAFLPYTPAEIRTADLAPLALELARWGLSDAGSLVWLDPPSDGTLAGARKLLRLLGALDDRNRISAIGEEMTSFPLHPRLARLLIAAKDQGKILLGCDLAALLSEGEIVQRESARGQRDIAEQIEILHRRRRGEPLPSGIDAGACLRVERASRQLGAIVGSPRRTEKGCFEAGDLARLLACAFPDRIAAEREPGSGRYATSGGKGGRLLPGAPFEKSPMLIAVEMEGGAGGEGTIRKAFPLTMDILEDVFGQTLNWHREVVWDEREERAAAREVRRLGALVLAIRQSGAEPHELTAAVLEGVRRQGLDVLGWSEAARQLVARVRFVAGFFPDEGWPDFTPAALLENLDEWLRPFLDGIRTRSALERLDPLLALESRLSWPQKRRLEETAPTHLTVPSGHRIPIDYTSGADPVLAVKLQELFGLTDTPRIAEGRASVLLHLLSPARRPIQITRDLRSFWDNVYPEVKKELKGRYPKHPWPDDPWSATPTRRTKKGGDGR